MFWTSNMKHPLASVLAITAIVINLGESLLAFFSNRLFEWLCRAYLSVFKKKNILFLLFFSFVLGTDFVIGECIDLYIYSSSHFINTQSPLDQECLKALKLGFKYLVSYELVLKCELIDIHRHGGRGWDEMHWWLLVLIVEIATITLPACPVKIIFSIRFSKPGTVTWAQLITENGTTRQYRAIKHEMIRKQRKRIDDLPAKIPRVGYMMPQATFSPNPLLIKFSAYFLLIIKLKEKYLWFENFCLKNTRRLV